MANIENISDSFFQEAIKIEEELYKKVLTKLLKREPKEEDFRRVTIGIVEGSNIKRFMFDGENIGHIETTMFEYRLKMTFYPYQEL